VKTLKKLPVWGWVLIALAAAALLCLALRKPIWYLYREVSFSWQERTEGEHRVHDYAKEQGIPYGVWPESLIDLLERNPETEDFVLGYPFREETPRDLSEYHESEEVPLFLQWDKRWGYTPYGSDMIAITGCGPTCLAMVGFYLTGDEVFHPALVAEMAECQGYYAPGYGSSWTLISEGAVDMGLAVTELPLVKKKMVDALEGGCPIILALGPGDFTTTGHYIVLTGVKDGAFRVNDPNSIANSSRLWTYEQLEPQIRNIWAISAEG